MYKQPLLKTTILARLFYLFILLLMVTLFLSLYNSYSLWRNNHQAILTTMAKQLSYQFDDYRYQANSLYKLANEKSVTHPPVSEINTLHSTLTKIRHDVSWLSSSNQTIDSIIFGSDKPQNIILATELSDYMEVVWADRNEYNSMYFLNGSDNTLILVTTHSILKPELRYKESYLILSAEEKRADMLTQSTLLDKREVISNVQKIPQVNDYFYTYRLMFNSPGQLTSVISFDVSMASILPVGLIGTNFSIAPLSNEHNNNVVLRDMHVVFSQAIPGSHYQLFYKSSLKDVAIGIIGYNFWLLICMVFVVLLVFFTSIFIRNRIISPNIEMLNELKFKDSLNNDLINNINYGILVYDFSSNKKILSNNLINPLLPSMELSHIKEMAIHNHDMIQVSIENIVYEVILVNVSMKEDTYLFIVIDKDKEALAQKRQELANKEYQRIIQLRKIIFENMHNEIHPPLLEMSKSIETLEQLSELERQNRINEIILQLSYINRWFDHIHLLNKIELSTLSLKTENVSIGHLVSQFLKQNLPLFRRKGLCLYFYNQVNIDSLFTVNAEYLHTVLQLILEYSIDTTSFGKIAITLNYQNDKKEISIDIKDSGAGLTSEELLNIQHPFSGKIQTPSSFTRSGVTFYLCRMLCKKMGGRFTIHSSIAIGSHYKITLPIESATIVDNYPPLLEDINIRLSLHNLDVSRIIKNTLTHYGAKLLDLNENSHHNDWDLLITDNDDNDYKNIVKVSGNIININKVTPQYIEANYNFANELIDAISLLIENSELEYENSLSSHSVTVINDEDFSMNDKSLENILLTYRNTLSKSDYKDLFITTVPMDINKLYNSESVEDLTELKNTAHRLKGVFAMLDFKFLHKICENLELYIAEENSIKISDSIRKLDISVKKLMPEGNL
ncbi:phosphotransferase RcsD [Providencia sneebia]|uniref:Phosphotransfer intermediate protein in two-component regulatory system with RcsBC n=1 Tax=Providencia sneebia DSM 19967 TaxID=1141660 RepID=K8WH44_9GAMM|nr:phosphotransferase RcsD [Providencia sneebia]EKT55585.1 phosphotransfer intermediate protein in two-component regulatory system with RcsBC [Providencia sneebia DSM 19967]